MKVKLLLKYNKKFFFKSFVQTVSLRPHLDSYLSSLLLKAAAKIFSFSTHAVALLSSPFLESYYTILHAQASPFRVSPEQVMLIFVPFAFLWRIIAHHFSPLQCTQPHNYNSSQSNYLTWNICLSQPYIESIRYSFQFISPFPFSQCPPP